MLDKKVPLWIQPRLIIFFQSLAQLIESVCEFFIKLHDIHAGFNLDPDWLLKYCEVYGACDWAENVFFDDADRAYRYAVITNKRFRRAEPYIQKKPLVWEWYCDNFKLEKGN